MTLPADFDIWERRRSESSRLSDELLRARIVEAVAWCDTLKSLEDFRAEALSPRLFHDGPDDLVCDLGRNRQYQLRCRSAPVPHQSPIIATGRFMLYFPDENLADGCAGAESRGFFDVNNVPAYDTWVSFYTDVAYPSGSAQRYLLCYVPAPVIEAAGAGIDVNPEACIVWLDDSDASIRQRVERLVSVERSRLG